jgi:hypothetical protein
MKTAIRLVLFLLTFYAPAGFAHETTRSYLTLSRENADLQADLRVAFRDIEVAVWLDDNLDGGITWRETLMRLPQVVPYVTAGLLFDAGGPCTLQLTGQAASVQGGIDYLDLRFAGRCPDADAPLRVTSRLFADIDPDHRVFLTLTGAANATTAVLGGPTPSLVLDRAGSGLLATFLSYAQAGVLHLAGGADHIVFLFVLILPAVALSTSPRRAIASVVLAATGFTVAHALTLSAATLNVLRPRSDVIEVLIALSIIVTAADNIRAFLPAPRAVVAAFFGLIHGFGFATALTGFALSSGTLATALLGFNIGIEVAQMAVIALMVPALMVLRAGRALVWAGSGAAILIGAYWAVLRLSGWA